MSLIAPLFLFGFLALVIPWWLHRISTDDPPQQEFGSSMLLEQQQTVSSKHTRLRYWPLLSLRTLAIALLALLFAEPVFQRLKVFTEEATRHLVVVDTSLSQGHTERWQRTIETANSIIDNIPAGDEVSVIAASDSLQQTAVEDYTVATARAQISALQPDTFRLEFSRFTRAITAAVNSITTPVEVHFVSDMQRSAMPERFSDLAIPGIQELHLYSTAATDDANTSVTAVVDESADNLADVSVLVQNHSTEPVIRELAINSTAQRKTVEVAGGSRTLVAFESVDTSNAGGQLTVTLSPGDALAIDDTYTVAIPDGERSEVSVVTGIRASVANTYVTAALESDPRYRAREVAGDTISANEAGATLIVPDASTLTDRATTRLQDFVNNGGSALVIAGSDPHSTNMRSLLGVSGNLTQQTDVSGNPLPAAKVTTTDATQPLVKGLASDWRALSVQRKLSISAPGDDTVILATDDGSPLLIERTTGNGRLLILTTALDPSWSNLALEPLFVAFVIRSVEYLQGETTANPYRAIGESINLPPGAQLLNESGESLRDISDLTGSSRYTFTEPGVYTIKSVSGNRYLSVNTDPQESAIQPIDDTLIEQWKNLTADNVGNVAGQNVNDPPGSSGNAAPTDTRSIWYWILLLLAFTMLVESLYSHRHLWVKRGA